MLNYIWLGLLVLAVVIGGWNGVLKAVAGQSFEMAKFAVLDTAFPLVGIMALWLGIMRVAERAGLVSLLARALRPLMRRLFRDVPPEHPAMGTMLMNIAANMLGLGNAATPLGLRAMKDLETLNPRPGTATNAMCTLLAINTSSVQLIPMTAIAILAANKSVNPTAIVGTALMATACAALSGVTMAKILERIPVFRLPPITLSLSPSGERVAARPGEGKSAADGNQSLPTPPATSQSNEKPAIKEATNLQPLQWWGRLLLSVFALFFAALFVRLALPEWWRVFADLLLRCWVAIFGGSSGHILGILLVNPNPPTNDGLFVRVVDSISKLAIPFLLSAFPLYAALRHVKVYEEFVDGAKEGFEVAIRIVPYLVAILVAIGMFRAAGGIDLLSKALAPAMLAIGFPPDLLPLVLMRPLSGSGTLGIFAELVKQFGPDSLIARMGGTIYGSTETTFYVLAVYFGSVGIKKTRHAVLAGLTADLVGVVASLVVCRLVFG
jgi:spore maturation protein SpmA